MTEPMNMRNYVLRKIFEEAYGTSELEVKTVNGVVVIVFTTQKGGVGKTTGSTNVAMVLSMLGYKVLFVDSDPQTNSSMCFGYDKFAYQGFTLSDLLLGKCRVSNAINTHQLKYKYGKKSHPLSEIDVVYSDEELNNVADIIVADKSKRDDQYFQNIFAEIENEYDFIIYDTNPTINVLVRNALNHASEVIVPIQLEAFAMEGYGKLLQEISNTDNAPNILGCFGIQKKNWSLHNQYLDKLNEHSYFKPLMFNSVISDTSIVAEAQAVKTGAVTYKPTHKASKAFGRLTLEIIERLEVKYGQ